MQILYILVFFGALILFITNAYVWLDEHNLYNKTSKSYYHRKDYIQASVISSGFSLFLLGVLAITISYLFY